MPDKKDTNQLELDLTVEATLAEKLPPRSATRKGAAEHRLAAAALRAARVRREQQVDRAKSAVRVARRRAVYSTDDHS